MLNKRTRIVSIRLSEAEYRKLGEICVQVGARSISDWVRQRLAYTGSGEDGVAPDMASRLWQLDCNLNNLRDEVARLASVVGSLEPGETAETSG